MPSWLFPQAGVNRAVGKQRQPPFTTPDAQNAIPESPQDGRIRGGVRPGLVRVHDTTLSDHPVRLLDSITVKIPGSTLWYFRDSFDYVNFPPSWTTADNCIVGLDSTAPTLSRGSIIADTADAQPQKVIRRAKPADMKAELDPGDTYMLGMYVRPHQNAHHGVYSLYARLDSDPSFTSDSDILEARLAITDAGNIDVRLFKGTTQLENPSVADDLVTTEGWFQMKIEKGDPDDIVNIYWRGYHLISRQTSISSVDHAGYGFGLKATTPGGRCIVDRVRLDYPAESAKEQLRPIVFFVQDGKLFHDKAMPGRFPITDPAGSIRFADDRPLQCAVLGGRVYFADNSDPVASGTDGDIDDGDTFTSASIADWTDILSASPGPTYFGDFVVHVTSPPENAGVYPIAAFDASTLTIYKHVDADLEIINGGAPDGSPLTFRVERGPKVWDPITDVITPWVTISGAGTIPCGCRTIESDGGRLHLAADPLDPNQLYGSAIGEPHNWQFSDVEAGSAFELGAADDAKVGDAVVALMAYKDDIKLIGCRSECWILRGAPPDGGGGAEVVSRHAGTLSFSSYCHGENGELYWLGRNGVFMATPECLACEPQAVSNVPLPRDLIDRDAGSLSVLAAYDRRARGVLFCLTPDDPVAQVRHWFYYVPTKAFFPIVIRSAEAYPTALKWLEMPDPEDSGLYCGSFGGSIRRFSFTAANDDVDPIASYVDIGPIELGPDEFTDGVVSTLRPILGADSGDVTYEIYFGATMEEAMEATVPFQTGTFQAGVHVERPIRGSGGAVRLRLIGQAGKQWSLERIAASIGIVQRARST